MKYYKKWTLLDKQGPFFILTVLQSQEKENAFISIFLNDIHKPKKFFRSMHNIQKIYN